MTSTFTIQPQGPFSLHSASGHAFGPRTTGLCFAFCVDGFREHAGVTLRQDARGKIHGTVQGAFDADAVRRQIARILSLDLDGSAWTDVGKRDRVIGRLQQRFPAFRPVLHYSPYEAATWSVLVGRRGQKQAATLRNRIAREFGETFVLQDQPFCAFPSPVGLLRLKTMSGITEKQVRWLRGIAEAALRGELDPARLREMGPDQARAHLRRLPGIGEFYSGLIAIRAIGFSDALAAGEPKTLQCVKHYYELSRAATERQLEERAETWRPFRNWAAVLLRRAGYEDGVA